MIQISTKCGLAGAEISKMEAILSAMFDELARGDAKYGPHAGQKRDLGALKAEVQELGTEVWAENVSIDQKRKKAIQVGAMVMEFIRDCC